MDFLELAAKRYSCKGYGDRVPESDKLQKVLEAGRLAPTAKNLQEQHVYIAKSADALAKIDEATPCRYGAPVVLVVTWDNTRTFTYPGGKRDSGIEDASIVATHLMLAAADQGLDSCWVNFFDPDKLHDLLGLPDNEEILMLLDIGYASPEAGPLPNHSLRRPLSETTTEI